MKSFSLKLTNSLKLNKMKFIVTKYHSCDDSESFGLIPYDILLKELIEKYYSLIKGNSEVKHISVYYSDVFFLEREVVEDDKIELFDEVIEYLQTLFDEGEEIVFILEEDSLINDSVLTDITVDDTKYLNIAPDKSFTFDNTASYSWDINFDIFEKCETE